MKEQLLACPFCGGKAKTSREDGDERIGYNHTITIACDSCGSSLSKGSGHDKSGWCNETAESTLIRASDAWNTRQAALAHASSASAEECSVDAQRLDALQSIVESGQRVEFAKSLVGNGVEIGVRFPSRAVVADNLREAIDQAIAGRRGDGHG